LKKRKKKLKERREKYFL